MVMTRRDLRRCGGAVVLVLAFGCDSPAVPASSEGPAASPGGETTGTSGGGGGEAGGSMGSSGGVEPNPQPTTGTEEAFEGDPRLLSAPVE